MIWTLQYISASDVLTLVSADPYFSLFTSLSLRYCFVYSSASFFFLLLDPLLRLPLFFISSLPFPLFHLSDSRSHMTGRPISPKMWHIIWLIWWKRRWPYIWEITDHCALCAGINVERLALLSVFCISFLWLQSPLTPPSHFLSNCLLIVLFIPTKTNLSALLDRVWTD